MAGVYIQGMEMPTGNNAVTIIIFPSGKVSLAHDNHFDEYAKAVPVPPHGRLIDADALPLEENVPTVMMHDGEKWLSAYELVMAPTIIPADKEAE